MHKARSAHWWNLNNSFKLTRAAIPLRPFRVADGDISFNGHRHSDVHAARLRNVRKGEGEPEKQAVFICVVMSNGFLSRQFRYNSVLR